MPIKTANEELGRLSVAEFKQSAKIPLRIVLDNVRSMNNIGSVFRTSDAFRAAGIDLCGITATPPNTEIHKTALGATESVDWRYFATTAEALTRLKAEGYTIIAIEQTSNSIELNNFMPETNHKYAVIFGHEVKGIHQEIVDLADICIEIPQYGTKHSLNISVCAGIVIYSFFQKLFQV